MSPPVRECLSQRLEAWRGEDAELSRRWVDDAIADLPPHDQPAARLVLLTAFAAYRVDEKTVKDFRAHQPDDADLVAAAAWASFATVKRISRWLIPADERRP